MLLGLGAASDVTNGEDVFATFLRNNANADPGASFHYTPTAHVGNGIKFGNSNAGFSVKFKGVYDYLEIDDHADLEIASSQFTMECWFYQVANSTSGSGSHTLMSKWDNDGRKEFIFRITDSGGQKIQWLSTTDGSSNSIITGNTTVTNNAWHHAAATRDSGGTIRMFLDGVLQSSTLSQSSTYTGTHQFMIGANGTDGITQFMDGYISNVRFIKGSCLYTSTFTPPTTALKSVSNTKLLCCNQNTITGSTVTPDRIKNTSEIPGQVVGENIPLNFGPFTGDDGAGGLIWTKNRSSQWHVLYDTVRGGSYSLSSNGTDPQANNIAGAVTFNNGGYSITSGYAENNASNQKYVDWLFRESEGFFDIVQFSGNGVTSGRAINHNLKSVPGMIIVKRTNSGGSAAYQQWFVYHDAPSMEGYRLKLQSDDPRQSDGNQVWGTGSSFVKPTSTQFTVGEFINYSGGTYIAYLFAGGRSTAATARSVSFSTSATYLSIPDSNDFDFGSTFTFEAWVKPEFHGGNNNLIFEHQSFQISITDTGRFNFDLNHIHTNGDLYSSAGSVPEGQWTHVAVVGTSGTLKMYINGVNDQSHNRTGVNITGDTGAVNISDSGGYYFKGEISNLRIVKGTAVYTSSFIPPTEPLTNITNTVLLCCNNSSTTGSTVTPGTITSHGSPGSGTFPTASTYSPFSDPAGFAFGESGKEDMIKTGHYTGNGGTNGPVVYLGWQPQWVMVKRVASAQGSSSGLWLMSDNMRGVFNTINPNSSSSEGYDPYLQANDVNGEYTTYDWIEYRSDGFKLRNTGQSLNADGSEYVYIAIRASDGYTSKLPTAGSEVFTITRGNGRTSIPAMVAGFPVDFFIMKYYNSSSGNFDSSTRLTGNGFVRTNTKEQAQDSDGYVFDSSVGIGGGGVNWIINDAQGWLWKRGRGCDIVLFEGNSVQGHDVRHGLGVPPDMMWVKNRTRSLGGGSDWFVYVRGITYLNVYGSDPDNYGDNPAALELNNTDQANFSMSGVWDHTHPTSTHFRVGDTFATNENGSSMQALLFASIEGISKIGYYAGNGNADRELNFGFRPKFFLHKRVDGGGAWSVYDEVLGLDSNGVFNRKLRLDTNGSQTTVNHFHQIATGVRIQDVSGYNANGEVYIYYAHS